MKIEISEELKSLLQEIKSNGADPGAALDIIFQEWKRAKQIDQFAEELKETQEEIEATG